MVNKKIETDACGDQNWIFFHENVFDICNCHVELVIMKMDHDERDFETEISHEKTDELFSTARYPILT